MIWDMQQGPRSADGLGIRTLLVNVAFSGQGKWLLTEHADGAIYAWDLTAPDITPTG